jgi:hypothetical protein
MKITERKEVTHTIIEEVIVGRKCDICGKTINCVDRLGNYNFFTIHTWHNDWGNDSCESHEYLDACSPECVMKFTEEYIRKSFEQVYNSKQIEIEHVRGVGEGITEYTPLF